MSVNLREPVEDGDRLWIQVSLFTGATPRAYSASYRFRTKGGGWSITTRNAECPDHVLRAAVESRITQARAQIDHLEVEVGRLSNWLESDPNEPTP